MMLRSINPGFDIVNPGFESGLGSGLGLEVRDHAVQPGFARSYGNLADEFIHASLQELCCVMPETRPYGD